MGTKAAKAKPTSKTDQAPLDIRKPRILRIFISYASEDASIAKEVLNALNEVVGENLAEVFIDTALEVGFEVKPQLEERLEGTDILIIIYTGTQKLSYSWTGWELGFFTSVLRQTKEQVDIPRRIVSFYLNSPPATTGAFLGLGLGISRDVLSLTEREFRSQLDDRIDAQHPIVKFFGELEDLVSQLIEQAGLQRGRRKDIPKVVRDMLANIFSYLKTTVDTVLKPQKQIIIKTDAVSLEINVNELPRDAQLAPAGSGSPLSIFGLPDATITWESFVSKIADHKFGPSWRDAIASVVISSLQDKMEIDNSQVIISSDNKHVYRVILTTSTTYFNGAREFNLYLVEALRPNEYGDEVSTLLLKGLEIVCRFRFMFLEKQSEFGSQNISALALERIPDLTRDLIRELNLLRRDSQEAGLDQPNVWSAFVSWDVVLQMSKGWEPVEKKLREVAAKIVSLRRSTDSPEELVNLRDKLIAAIAELEETTRSQNRTLIDGMTKKLSEVLESESLSEKAEP